MQKISKGHVVAAVLLLLLILKFVQLDKDPPLFHLGYSNALLTDPYHLTFFARNAVLYGDWNPFDSHRWDYKINSLISGVSYLFFLGFNVSRVTANLAAVILQCGGFLFFILGIYRFRGLREVGLAALLLLINSSLFFYGRLPFLENGLIFISGLTFLIFVRYHNRYWGQFLSGVLIALAALSGKLFGFILLGPVLISLFYMYRKRVVVPVVVTVGGLLIGTATYILAFYGRHVSALVSYYNQQSVGTYGLPPGFSSIENFFVMLVTYGSESGIWQHMPFLLFLTAVSFILVTMVIPYTGKPKIEYLPVIFCAAWLASGILGLMPFNYRPLRYTLFLYLPISAICAFGMRLIMEKRMKLGLHSKWISLTSVFLVCWYTTFQITILLCSRGRKFYAGTEYILAMMIIAIVITLLTLIWLRKDHKVISNRFLQIPFGVIFLWVIVNQGIYLFDGLTKPGRYLERYNTELSQIVSKNAVITGPFTPALTIDNRLQGIIYMFGFSNVEYGLFERFPISHVVSDRSNWTRALKDFPFLKTATKIAQMVVKNDAIDLYRLPHTDVPLTDFEQGVILLEGEYPESSLVYFERFSEKYPENLLGNMHLTMALYVSDSTDKAIVILNELIDRHPNNYMLHGFCKGFYYRLYRDTEDSKYLQLSQSHERKVRQLNPDVPGAH
ncbi:MAG: hypothetical protein ABII79_00495 [bacterium]